jgi:hypothetical protein
MPELPFQGPAELREGEPVQVQALEDDRRAVLELREDALHLGRGRERRRAPGEVGRVARDLEFGVCLGETEARVPKPAGCEKPLDVRDRQEVVEATLLGPRDYERLLFPVAVEELLGGDRIERAS